ncbi:GAF domain-containing protein [Geomesophilobacter sediminis]|uniref:histidine kinase n=1 Tax=Geomesophilobacter sediminis TaxID=2798584 RepID=A0A8J7J4H1_9BACT|nr:GAF domain-containing protein [Geomesophilobacter sediminis]MBJ6725773.1 GAF domain-containing protein [Geomesophilobacter sediminis]
MTWPKSFRAGRTLAVLPILVLPLLMAVLQFGFPATTFFDPPWLIMIANTLFVGCVSFILAGIVWRNYLLTGRIQVLLLGCAMLLFGMGGVIAAFVRGLPGGVNLNVTIYNCGALMGGVLHFLAGLILSAGHDPEAAPKRRTWWLCLGYLGTLLFMGAVTLATFRGAIPLFFRQGAGPTLLRQEVLGSSILLFLFSCLVFLTTYLRRREPFLLWYAGALALTAISLTGFFIQHSVGSPVGWVGRISQYLGGVYFLAALVVLVRSAQSRGMSLDDALVASLTGAEEKFRSAFAHAAIGFAMTTPDGRFVDANPAYCAATGYHLSELRKLDFAQLIHPEDREANLVQIRSMLAGEIPAFTVENRYLRKEGEPIWVRKSVSLVRDAGGAPRWIVALIENVTERKQIEQQQAQDLGAMTLLHHLGTLLVSGGNGDLQPVLEEILVAAIQITGADFGNIQLLDHATGDLHIAVQRGFPRWWLEYWDAVTQGQGACGTALERRERVIIEDVEASPVFAGTPALEIQLRAGVRAVQSTPMLKRSGDPVGMISTHYKTPRRPDDHALRLLDLLCRQAADLIARLQTDEALRAQAEQLRQSREEALVLAQEATAARTVAERTATVLRSINLVLEQGLANQTEAEMCGAILGILEGATESRISFIAEMQQDRRLCALAISNPGWEACQMYDAAGPKEAPTFPLHGIYGKVLQDGKSLIVNAPAAHPDRVGLPENHPPLESFLGVPLFRDGNLIGMIAVGNREGGYRLDDQQALEAMAPVVVETLFRKRTEAKLFAAHHRLTTLMNALPVGVSFSDDETCRNITGNPTVLRQFEVSPTDNLSASAPEGTAPGRQVKFFLDGREISDAELPLQRAVAEGRDIPPLELRVELPSGRRWFASASGAPLHDQNGRVIGGVAVTMDITERKIAETTLQELNRELELRVHERTAELREKDRLMLLQGRQAAMGEMIGNIAHQWRQPLNNLGLTIQRLPLMYNLGKLTQETLEETIDNSMKLLQHMSQTIDDFRNFFKPDKEKAEFQVGDAIAAAVTLTEDRCRYHNIAVKVSAEAAPSILGYKNEYSQVLLNIMNNAMDVLTEREVPDPAITITLRAEGGRSVVTVRDNAGGVPNDIIGKIFDPYFSTKGPQHGTGLGLFMAKTIIEKNMEGKLSVSNVAEGAEFRIEL